MIFQYLNIKYFIISLCIGIFYIYILENKQIIYIYPNPDNIDKYQYKDKTDNCFKYDLEETNCDNTYKYVSPQR